MEEIKKEIEKIENDRKRAFKEMEAEREEFEDNKETQKKLDKRTENLNEIYDTKLNLLNDIVSKMEKRKLEDLNEEEISKKLEKAKEEKEIQLKKLEKWKEENKKDSKILAEIEEEISAKEKEFDEEIKKLTSDLDFIKETKINLEDNDIILDFEKDKHKNEKKYEMPEEEFEQEEFEQEEPEQEEFEQEEFEQEEPEQEEFEQEEFEQEEPEQEEPEQEEPEQEEFEQEEPEQEEFEQEEFEQEEPEQEEPEQEEFEQEEFEQEEPEQEEPEQEEPEQEEPEQEEFEQEEPEQEEPEQEEPEQEEPEQEEFEQEEPEQEEPEQEEPEQEEFEQKKPKQKEFKQKKPEQEEFEQEEPEQEEFEQEEPEQEELEQEEISSNEKLMNLYEISQVLDDYEDGKINLTNNYDKILKAFKSYNEFPLTTKEAKKDRKALISVFKKDLMSLGDLSDNDKSKLESLLYMNGKNFNLKNIDKMVNKLNEADIANIEKLFNMYDELISKGELTDIESDNLELINKVLPGIRAISAYSLAKKNLDSVQPGIFQRIKNHFSKNKALPSASFDNILKLAESGSIKQKYYEKKDEPNYEEISDYSINGDERDFDSQLREDVESYNFDDRDDKEIEPDYEALMDYEKKEKDDDLEER